MSYNTKPHKLSKTHPFSISELTVALFLFKKELHCARYTYLTFKHNKVKKKVYINML